jgi:hypothetical protein
VAPELNSDKKAFVLGLSILLVVHDSVDSALGGNFAFLEQVVSITKGHATRPLMKTFGKFEGSTKGELQKHRRWEMRVIQKDMGDTKRT